MEQQEITLDANIRPQNDIKKPANNSESKTGISKNKRRKQTGVLWFDDIHSLVKGETSLWVAVITQAMMDALSHSRQIEAQYQKTEAIRWLTENTKDFYDVCMMADMNPDYVRRKAKKAIAAPVAWRAAPGKGKRYLERKNKKCKALKSPPENEPVSTDAIILCGPWKTVVKRS